MPPRFCCCEPLECDLLIDDFTRADSTSLGDEWVEVTGNSSIVSNAMLIEDSAKVASVIGNASHRGTIVFTWETPATGTAEIAVTLNYGGASPVTVYVAITDDDLTLIAGTQTRIIDNVNIGQNSQLLWARDSNDRYVVQACLTNNLLYVQCYTEDVSVKGGAVWDHEYTLPATGDGRLAIEAVSSDAIIDNLGFRRHYDDNTECPDYCCECTPSGTLQPDRRWYPWKTRVDFFSDDGTGMGCDIFNGGYLSFYNAVAGGTELGSYRWECYDGLMAGVNYGYGSGQPLHFFDCTGVGGGLVISFNPEDCGIQDILAPEEEGVVCDPFSVTYQEISTTDPHQCHPCVDSAGSWYAVMTDDT